MAENDPLPSRKAAVVLPLLEKFSPTTKTKKEILAELAIPLGEPDFSMMHSLSVINMSYFYTLDDKTLVSADFSGNKLARIILWPAGEWPKIEKVLYQAKDVSLAP